MPVLEVRRHAERATVSGSPSPLSPAGQAMCLALAKDSGPFALVVSSPLPRAKETAALVGGRLDAIDPSLLPDVGGANIFGDRATLAAWFTLVAQPEARVLVADQLAAWANLAARVKAKERVLAISHGGIVDLPATALMAQLGVKIDGPSFGFLEGVRVTYDAGAPSTLEVLRRRR